jgi:hypothetical protein
VIPLQLKPDRVPRVGAYIVHFLSKEAYNPTALEGQQWMKKAATWAAKCICTKVSATMVTADQLNGELGNSIVYSYTMPGGNVV